MDEDPESQLIGELRRLGGSAQGSNFVVTRGARRITVDYSGGSSASVTLSARYDVVARSARELPGARNAAGYRTNAPDALLATRPLSITLRPEGEADRSAKDEGMSVEHQSGDLAFDESVYVDTPTTSTPVLDAVLNEDVRAGVMALLAEGFDPVVLDDDHGDITARMTSFATKRDTTGRGERAVDAFARVLGNLPMLEHDYGERPRVPLYGLTVSLGLLGGAGWLLNYGWVGILALLFRATTGREPELTLGSVGLALIVGILAGTVGSALHGNAVGGRARGRSNAHRLVSTAAWCAFGGVSVLVFSLTLLTELALHKPT